MAKFHQTIILLLITCSLQAQNMQSNYHQEIEEWHKKRVTNLKSETGWLTVSGLFWLDEGINTVGSSKENKIKFPKNTAAEKLGNFTLNSGTVTINVEPGELVTSGTTNISAAIIFSDSIEEQEIILTHRDLRFFIIKRGTKIGLRLRDLKSPARINFTQIERFPIDTMYQVKARFEAAKANKTIPIHDVIGQTTETAFAGTLYFEVKGKKLQLDATLEGDNLFIVFADETSGNSTYGGGRFLYAKVPTSGNQVTLDFNKAYNPPCAFTDFATCPLPPDQNKMPIEILAGEKKYGRH